MTKRGKRNMKNMEFYFNRGLLFAEKNKFEKAIENFNTIIRFDKDLFRIWRSYSLLGSIYTDLEKYEKAIKNCTKVIELFEEVKKNSQYIEYFDEINELLAQSYANRGYCYNYTIKLEKAIEDYTKAIQLDPSCKKYHDHLKILKEEPPVDPKPSMIGSQLPNRKEIKWVKICALDYETKVITYATTPEGYVIDIYKDSPMFWQFSAYDYVRFIPVDLQPNAIDIDNRIIVIKTVLVDNDIYPGLLDVYGDRKGKVDYELNVPILKLEPSEFWYMDEIVAYRYELLK
jgi:tetratricopeptide (TPR) repeat protein